MRTKKSGISLVSLIITIVVIIILAAIVIFTGLSTPDQATFAKFTSEYSEMGIAVTEDYVERYTASVVNNQKRTKAQIYYEMASGIEKEKPEATGEVDELNKKLSLSQGLKGEEYYRITENTNIKGWDTDKYYFSPDEKHYITDEGELFVLPGYLVEEGDTQKWWVNEDKYYMGEQKELEETPGGEGTAEETCTITFDPNGGSGVISDVVVKKGDEYRLPNNSFMAPTGYMFNGWDVNGTVVGAREVIVVENDTTVKALWEKVTPDTYKVTIEANNGTGTVQTENINAGASYTLPASNTFLPEIGKEFSHWNVDGATKKPGDTITINNDTTISAVWKAQTFTITFNSNGGTGTMESITAVYNSTFNLPLNGFTAPKYKKFANWQVNDETKQENETITVKSDITIIPVWESLVYTITLIADNGTTTTKTATSLGGETYTLPANDFDAPTNYTFAGWNVNGEIKTPNSTIIIEGDIDIRATWKKVGFTVEGIETSYTYTGSPIKPVPTVKADGVELKAGEDYDVIYGENTNKGTGTVTITYKGKYDGSEEITFAITAKEIDAGSIVVENVNSSYEYTGSQIAPTPLVKVDGNTLATSEYTVVYGTNTTKGEGTIVITLTGNYSGIKEVKFTITPKKLNEADITISNVSASYTYKGSQITPVPVVSVDKNELATNTYTVEYGENVKVGTGTVKVTLGGNYEGSKTVTFNIVAMQISASDISTNAINASYTYTGEEIKPITDVIVGRVLSETEYEIEYQNNTNVTSKATVTITLKGNYTGTKVIEFAITPKEVSANNITTTEVGGGYTYTGSEIKPIEEVRVDGKTLTEGTDYEVTYANNTYATTGSTKATATITLKGNYSGTKVVEFDIVGKNIAAENIITNTVEPSYTFTGNQITPITSVEVEDKTLVEGTDYEIDYANNTNASTESTKATATITLKGNYTGEKVVEFEITAKEISAENITTNTLETSYTYTGDPIKPITSVKANGTQLVQLVDYTVTYEGNTEVGKGKAKIKLINNYSGEKVVEFNIVAKDVSEDVISTNVIEPSYTYTGAAIEPITSVEVEGNTLSADEYEVVYANNVNASTESQKATATITTKGTYTGVKVVEFTIAPKSIEGVTLEVVPGDYTYTGAGITPGVTVTDGSLGELTLDEDYTVGYEENTNAGPAIVTITGKGNYTGTKSTTFTIDKADMTVTADDYNDTYDGMPHAITLNITKPASGAKVYYSTEEELTDANHVSAGTEEVPTRTDAGNTRVYYYIVAENYNDASGSANIVINKRNITVKPEDKSKTYDGDPLTSNTPKLTDGTLAEGHKFGTMTTTGSRTDVGTSENEIDTIEILDAGNNDVTENYNITPAKGTLTVTAQGAANFVISLGAYDDVYDGTQKRPAVTVTVDGEEIASSNYDAVYTNNIDAGDAENSATVTVTGKAGGNYEGSSASKNFTISKRPVTIKAKSRTDVYTGTPLTDVTLVAEGLATDHVLTGYAEGSQTNVGESSNIVKSYTIKAGEDDVTRNYIVTPVAGTLTVTPKEVTVTAETTTFNYDGTAKKPTATVSGAVAGETINLNITTTPEQAIEPGTHSATVTIGSVTGENALVSNYTLSGTTTFDFSILAKITFDANDGSESMEPVYKAVGSTYELPTNGFTAPQYKEFAGWEVNGETKAVGDEITIEGNTTIKAVWKVIEYTVTIEANNGTDETTSETVDAGSEYTLPTCEYTYQGFEFEGWSVNGGATQAAGTTIIITGNTVLTAVWKNAKFEVGDLIEDEGIKIGDYVNYTPYTASNTYKTTIDGTSSLYTGHADVQTLTRLENTTWRVIKVDTENNEIIITPTDALNELTLEGVPGYFNHKNVLNDVSNKLYSNTVLGLISRSMVLEDLDYTVTDGTTGYYAYYPNGTSSLPDKVYNGKTYTGVEHCLPTGMPYEDYRFWEYDYAEDERIESINGKMYTYGYPTSNSPVLVSQKRAKTTKGTNTSKAQSLIGDSFGWVASSNITTFSNFSYLNIIFMDSMDMDIKRMAYSYGSANSFSSSVRPVLPISYAVKLVESGTKVDGSTTYKVWDIDSNITKHTVSFEANGGSGSMESVSVATGSSYSLPANIFTAPTNKEFAGWLVNSETKATGDIINVTSDMTIKATWKATQHSVTLVADNGTDEQTSVMVNAGENYILPSCPFTAPVNKKFVAWLINGGTQCNPGVSFTVTDATTVTAVWSDVTLEVSGVNASYTYTGAQITPDPVVKADGVALTRGTDYDVAYGENKKAGTNGGSVTVTYKDKYEGTETINFTITPKNISSVTMELDITEYTFDGTAKTPSVTVTDGSLGGLTQGTDYTVAWTNNTKAALNTDENAPTVTITGANNYTGTKSVTFTIKKADMVVAETNFSGTYDGTAHSATVSVTTPATGATIYYKEGTELTASNYNTVGSTNVPTRTNVGNSQIYYYVVAENYNDYSGSVNTVISQRAVNVKADDITRKYNGEELTSTAATASGLATGHKLGTVATNGKITNVGSVDNEITSVTILDASNNDVTNNYAITPVKGTLAITPEDAATFTITVGAYDNVYDGTAKTPTVTVKVGTKTVPESEYIVSHSNNVDAGTTATVTVTGKADGNYAGSESSQYFTINKRPLTITAGSGSKVYDGTKLEVTNVTSEGLVSGHTLTATTQGSQTNVGSSANTIATYSIKAGNTDVTSNYAMTPVAGTLTVTAKTATVTVGSTTLNYNGAEQKPSVTVSGAVAGETINLSITTTPVSAKEPGTYSATVTIGSVTGENATASNYTLSGTTTFDFTILARIMFDIGDGSGSMPNQYVALNSGYTLPPCTATPPDGYEFQAWSVNGMIQCNPGVSFTVTGNTIITAVWKKLPTFADIKIGDYVSYTGDGSYYVDDSITGATQTLCDSYGYTYQGGTTLKPESATWRVWDIKDDGSIVIMPTAPVNTINLGSSAGYINAEKVLDGVSEIYTNSSLGVTAEDVESLRIEDLEERSSTLVTTRDSYQATSTSYPAYGETNYQQWNKYYTSGTFYAKYNSTTGKNEVLTTPITASSSNKVELLQTYYYASNPTWNSITNSNFSGLTYGTLLGTTYGWLASPCVDLYSSDARFDVHRAGSSGVGAYNLYDSDGYENCYSYGVRPLVSLGSELQIKGGDGKTTSTAWVLKSNATKYTVSFDSNSGTGTMASKQAVANYKLTLPHCEFTAPSGYAFIGWEVNEVQKAVGDIVTITANTVIKALWGRPIGSILEIGDYVDYISDEAVDSNVAWRVWDKDANGNIIITPTNPVGYMQIFVGEENLLTKGPEVHKNAISNIEAGSDKYTSAELGVTADDIRSMRTSDIEDADVSDILTFREVYKNYEGIAYGTICTFTSGTFHMQYDEATGTNVHLDTPITATESAPVKLLNDYYYSYEGQYTWSSLNNSKFSTETYGDILGTNFGWLATTRVEGVPGDVAFYVDTLTREVLFPALTYSTTFGENLDGGFRPLITLDANLQIDGGDGASADTAWVVVNDATKYTITFEANGGTGDMAPKQAVEGYEYRLPECGFTAPDGMVFTGWSVDGTTYNVGDRVTISGNTTVKAIWKETKTVGELMTNGIAIGDYVTYSPVTASSTYKTGTEGDLYTGYDQQTLSTTRDTVWRVIKVDETNNEVLITPTDAVNTDTGLYLSGAPGYINYKTVLDDVCNNLYSNTTLGLTARSMIMEDLDITISDATSSRYAYYPNGASSTPDVTYNGVTYTGRANKAPSGDDGYGDYRFWEYDYAADERTQTINGKTYTYGYPTESSPVLVTENRNVITFDRDKLIAITEMIGDSYGWMASSGIVAFTDFANFYGYAMNSTTISFPTLAYSHGIVYSESRGLRPVVSLGSEIQLTESSTIISENTSNSPVWDIVENATPKHTVSFDSNGGTGTMSSVPVATGNNYSLPVNKFTAPIDKAFAGWNVNGTTYAVGDSIKVTGDVTVTAMWKSSGFTDPDSSKTVNVLSDSQITNENYKGNGNISMVLQAEGETTQVPVPTGFTYYLGTGDTGLVVKDASDNEFVWIPVADVTSMYTTGTSTSLSHYDSSFSVKTTMWGKSSINGQSMTKPNSTSSPYYKEPAIIVGNGTEYDAVPANYTQAGFNSLEEFATDLRDEFYAMIESVGKYGGFFVGRYELGYENSTVVCKPSVKVLTPSTGSGTDYGGSSGTSTWYGLYKACKEFTQGGVQSSMIWGSQWDVMVNFIGDHTAVTAGIYLTGKNPNGDDEYKNVHDTSSNVMDWTMTAYNNNIRALRGPGLFGNGASSERYCYDSPTNNTTYIGARTQLYIKN